MKNTITIVVYDILYTLFECLCYPWQSAVLLCACDADDKEGKRWISQRGLFFELSIYKSLNVNNDDCDDFFL